MGRIADVLEEDCLPDAGSDRGGDVLAHRFRIGEDLVGYGWEFAHDRRRRCLVDVVKRPVEGQECHDADADEADDPGDSLERRGEKHRSPLYVMSWADGSLYSARMTAFTLPRTFQSVVISARRGRM